MKLLQGLVPNLSGSQEASQPLYPHGEPEKKDNHIIFARQKKTQIQQKSNCWEEILAWGPVFFLSVASCKISTESNF